MNNRVSYLLNLVSSQKFEEVRDTWVSLGSLTINNKVKVYSKDTLFKIDLGTQDATGLNGYLIYCTNNYLVDENHSLPDWSKMDSSNITNFVYNNEGVENPCFAVIMTKDELDSIADVAVNENYSPFSQEKISIFQQNQSTDIQIDDLNLNLIMKEVAIPFLDFSEIEYSRETICNLCVYPALEKYYTYFPILKRETIHASPNTEIEYELPKGCFKIRRANFRQGGTGTSNSGFSGAYQFMNEQYTYGGGLGNSRFGRGLIYNKCVPGYTGQAAGGGLQQLMYARAINQALTNYNKRVRFVVDVEENGKKYAHGYSTIGGDLDLELEYWSPNFNLTDFDERDNIRKYATAQVMRSLSAIRSLIKPDYAGTIDFSSYVNRASELEKEVTEHWYNHPNNKAILIRGEA
jgi:hypothetical protein